MKYRKKPLVVDAVQFIGLDDNEYLWSDEPAWLERALRQRDLEITQSGHHSRVRMTTIHGDFAWANPGDWIVPEADPGRFYPIARDVFAATYEPAEEHV